MLELIAGVSRESIGRQFAEILGVVLTCPDDLAARYCLLVRIDVLNHITRFDRRIRMPNFVIFGDGEIPFLASQA